MAPQSGWFHNNFEQYQNWQIVNDQSVNPIPATATPINYAPDGSSMTMYTIGPDFAGWLAKKSLPMPLLLSSGVLTSSVDIWASPDALRAQAWEFDDRFTDTVGNVYPCDSNFVLARGGLLQSVTASGAGWVDTPFIPGPPPAGVWVNLSKTYAFDTKAKTCQMTGASFGPSNMKFVTAAIAALALKWDPLIIVKQNQIDENANGATYGLMTRNNNVSVLGNL